MYMGWREGGAHENSRKRLSVKVVGSHKKVWEPALVISRRDDESRTGSRRKFPFLFDYGQRHDTVFTFGTSKDTEGNVTRRYFATGKVTLDKYKMLCILYYTTPTQTQGYYWLTVSHSAQWKITI